MEETSLHLVEQENEVRSWQPIPDGVSESELQVEFGQTKVCLSAAGVPPPSIEPRLVLSLHSSFTLKEVLKSIHISTSKQYDLDPVLTWLVKICSDVLGSVISWMIKSLLKEGNLLESHKYALVQPRIKKLTLNPLDIKSFRPNSNLSFIVSKFAQHLVVNRFNHPVSRYHLLPVHQSVYWPHPSAIAVVHNDIVLPSWNWLCRCKTSVYMNREPSMHTCIERKSFSSLHFSFMSSQLAMLHHKHIIST